MGSVCSSKLLQYFNSKKRQNLISVRGVVLGLGGVGKTTLVYNMAEGNIVNLGPTISFNITSISFPTFSVDLWDVGGALEHRGLWRHYIHGCQLLMYVINGADSQIIGLDEENLELIRGLLPSKAILMVVATNIDRRVMSETLIKEKIHFDSFPCQRRKYLELVATDIQQGFKMASQIQNLLKRKP